MNSLFLYASYQKTAFPFLIMRMKIISKMMLQIRRVIVISTPLLVLGNIGRL